VTRVYLAVGHGRRPDGTFDPGAVGGDTNEQKAGDIIVAEAARLLRRAGVDVRDEAHKDDPNFVGTTRAANLWGADLLVSIHHDWIGAPAGAFGHWVSEDGKEAADRIQQAVGRAGFPLRPAWHKRREDLYVLNNTFAPAVLYEVGRIGDLTADALLRMGAAVADGVADWAGVDLVADGDDMDPDVLRQIVREELERAFDGRDYGNDMGRLRRSVRAIGGKLGLTTEYDDPGKVDA